MQTEFIESEKLWRAPGLEITYSGLGQAILNKLKEDDPKRVLEVHYDSGVHLTVGDVRCQTIAVAQNLVRLGVNRGDTVILYSMVNVKVTPITFACYTIGSPVNFFETSFQEDAIMHNLNLLNPTVIIYEEEYKSQLFKALKQLKLPKLRYVLSIDSETEPIGDVLFKPTGSIDSFEPTDIREPAKEPATLMLTSGTSGFPKVVLHSHAMMMKGLYTWWQLERNDTIFCFSPLRWISQVSLMLQSVFFGVQRIYTSKPPSAAYAKDIIDKYKVTHFFTVPEIYLRVIRAADECNESSNFASLKIALISGEVVRESLVVYSAKVIPKCRVVVCYGMTELAGCIASDEEISGCKVNGGALRKGLIAKIINDAGESLGPNEAGRLCLKSTVPFLGYLKNNEANKEVFLAGGWFNTGDYGFIDSDNLLNIITRYKNLIRSAGTIVIPDVIENIVNSHPKVLTSALVGHPNPINPVDEVGTVFVVLRSCKDSDNAVNDLKEFTGEKLTKEQLQIVRYFKVMPEMPLTSCGKLDRVALKEMAEK